MKKTLALLTVLSVVVVGSVAYANHGDPWAHVTSARGLVVQARSIASNTTVRSLLAQAITELDGALADLPAPSPSPTPTTTAPPPTTTAPPPTTTTTTLPTTTATTTAPPSSFPTREEALARSKLVVFSGTRVTQYKPAPAADTTYDFRGLTSTAYPSTGYPFVIDGARNVIVGGTVIGQQPRDWTWAQVHDGIGGSGTDMHITDYGVSYDERIDNTNDGIRPMPSVGLTGQFLIDGAYMTWIRDDAIEDDLEMSGTVRDVLVDGVNDAVSIGQSTKNANAVVNIQDALFIHAPMPNARAADGVGHQTIFKQMPGGRVNMSNVTDCLYENPITQSRIGIRPPGTWVNVVFVLGPGWVGADPTVPAGASVSRDWQGRCVDAAASWKAAHGY